ncbi:hypothetical protein [Defluviimonas salinarum]|uniref:hypothetical protein n=1 Tax=Defluviimonas salinarum TaxID=2992147 RepID=UPI00223010C7|nr:hypothetical protein [Defluviimonas salinarum]
MLTIANRDPWTINRTFSGDVPRNVPWKAKEKNSCSNSTRWLSSVAERTGLESNLLYRQLIDFIHLEDRSPILQTDDCVSLTAHCNLDTDQIPSAQKPVVGGVELGRKFAVFGHSLRPASRIIMRDEGAVVLSGVCWRSIHSQVRHTHCCVAIDFARPVVHPC